jgi:hypothetical protein
MSIEMPWANIMFIMSSPFICLDPPPRGCYCC